MTALYWTDHVCTEESRGYAHPVTLHVHTDDEQEACQAFVSYHRDQFPRRDERPGGSLLGARANCRYVCVMGPGGLVRAVAM